MGGSLAAAAAVFAAAAAAAAAAQPALLCSAPRLCACPVVEVPVDEKGRPYPYVLPPTFPGAYPTIASCGTAEHKQQLGLHPLMRVKMLVRYNGIANSPVKYAFRCGRGGGL
jgi:hypothetical protein